MIELSGVTWDHTRGYDPLIATVEEFRRTHPEVLIHWEKRSLHEFGHTPVDQLAQKYDLVVLDHPWVGLMAEKECYLPLEEWLPSSVLEDFSRNSVGPSHASYAWGGHQWGVAIDAATPSASYRPDLLARLDLPVPRTWDDVIRLGSRAQTEGLSLALPLGPVDAITAFLSLADNLEGSPFATTERVVSSDVGREVLAMLRTLLRYCPSDVFGLTPITTMERMSRTDQVVYCPLAYSYTNYSRSGYRPHLCRYSQMPVFSGCGSRGSHIGGTGLSISRRCQHPELAAEYVAKVAGGEWQSGVYFHAGGQPAHSAAWDSPELNRVCHDFFFATRETIDHAFLRPRYNGYIDFQYQGGAMVTRALQEGGNSDELLNDLDRLYRESVRGVFHDNVTA